MINNFPYEKCCRIYNSEFVNNFIQLCKSAILFIPIQFVEQSCVSKKSQHASFTSCNCSRFAADNKSLRNKQ